MNFKHFSFPDHFSEKHVQELRNQQQQLQLSPRSGGSNAHSVLRVTASSAIRMFTAPSLSKQTDLDCIQHVGKWC